MKRTHGTRAQRKRLDALLALPLERFRTAVARLTPEELAALDTRIDLMTVKHRWELGGHGLERHRAPLALELLARRQAVVRQALAASRDPQVRLVLVEPAANDGETTSPDLVENAA